MKPSRRDVFKFAGGAVAGTLFTPAPWRLITDTALWSENWPGVPRPARGEIRAKFTNCALCTGGCAVRARCVGEQPVSLAGVAGGLCPFGLDRPPPALSPRAPETGADCGSHGRRCQARNFRRHRLLDLNPGRTASWTYRRTMAGHQGRLPAPNPQPFAIRPVRRQNRAEHRRSPARWMGHAGQRLRGAPTTSV